MSNSSFLLGIVIMCPKTNKQVAIHRKHVEMTVADIGEFGEEIDIHIAPCPSCNTEHVITETSQE